MTRMRTALRAWVIALAMAVAAPASAQAPTESHLQAAWTAVRAVGADYLFDEALLDIADRLGIEMKDNRPDLSIEIDELIYDVALELVPRRLDLNNEVSRLWAGTFSESELNEITAFYTSDIGEKLNSLFAAMQRDTLRLLDAWYQRTMDEVRERMILRLQQQGLDY